MMRTAIRGWCIATAVAVSFISPARAQDHGGHAAHAAHGAPKPASPAAAAPASDPHAGHAMPPPQPVQPPPQSDPHAGHTVPAAQAPVSASADAMTGVDHGQAAAPSPGPEMETPPPPETGSGPPRAADAIWGADAMRPSRRELQQMHGDYPLLWLQADRFETQIGDGADGYLWDVQGYYGGPTNRFWFKSEGEGRFGKQIDDAEFQALYAQAIAPFFDVQAGLRQDVAGPDTTYAVLGIQGLAPYMFELDAALFLSHRGDLTARVEAELDQRITQRLIVQPRAELNLSAQDVPQLGIGAGLDSIEIGVRLRYEIVREFAPYVGVEQQWRTGRGAGYARAAGDGPSATRFIIGVRLWL